MKESDFPPGTIFVVKGFDPYAVFPGPGSISERVFGFGFGSKSRIPSRTVNLAGSNWPVSIPFDEWHKAVEEAAR